VCCRYLIKNPTFICITLVGTVEISLAAGFSTFMPKYISNQFNQTAGWAAKLTGELRLFPSRCLCYMRLYVSYMCSSYRASVCLYVNNNGSNLNTNSCSVRADFVIRVECECKNLLVKSLSC